MVLTAESFEHDIVTVFESAPANLMYGVVASVLAYAPLFDIDSLVLTKPGGSLRLVGDCTVSYSCVSNALPGTAMNGEWRTSAYVFNGEAVIPVSRHVCTRG